jgi:16S rRNA (adenine1518-N6/adenine1519-N6)-dimethyltransferase
MKLSQMKQILLEEGIQLTRSLGQSFLHDGNQLRRIVDASGLTQADRVLEIGPGLGPLTELLVERAGEVLAIEKDARLVRVLEHRFQAHLANANPTFRLLQDDALEYLRRQPQDWSEWKLVANLPYSVASPILVELAQGAAPRLMVATLQLEVARRLLAQPRTADYGVLTLLIQVVYEPHGWFKIPAQCFFPEPDVDSACVVLARREKPLLNSSGLPAFVKLVKQSFSQRRKMMFKLLREDWDEQKLESAFASAQVPAQSRAEAVSLEQFVRLAELLTAESSRE